MKENNYISRNVNKINLMSEMKITELIENATEAFNKEGDISCDCHVKNTGDEVDIIGFIVQPDPKTGQPVFKILIER